MLTPKKVTDNLLSHYYWQPLSAAVFFCLLPLAACKRIHVFLEGDLVAFQVFFQLVLDILLDHLRILAYRVHKVSSAPEISVPVLILQIGVPVENHQRTIAPERPHELCDTHVRRDTHQKMKVIRARFALDGLRFHLLAQLFDDLVDVPAHRLIDYLPAVLRCKYQAIFTPVTGVPPYALPHFSFA